MRNWSLWTFQPGFSMNLPLLVYVQEFWNRWYVCVCMCVHVHIQTYMYVCVFMHMHMCIFHVCICACTCICMCVHIYKCLYAHVCMHVYVHIHIACVYLTQIRCSFGIFMYFLYISRPERACFHLLCRRTRWNLGTCNSEASESDWESILPSCDQCILTSRVPRSTSDI